MANQPWLEDVQQRLIRSGLPSNYIQRFISELADHFEDIKEESMDADASTRLGMPQQLAEAAVVSYRQRNIFRRHPITAFLFFGLSPIMSLVAVIALLIGILVIVPDSWTKPLFAPISHFGNSASLPVAYFSSIAFVIIPSILVGILHCHLAKRWSLGKWWTLFSCMGLALFATLPTCTASVSPEWGKSWIRIGLWFPDNIWHCHHFITWAFGSPQQLMQFFVPLAVGLWFVWRQYKQMRLQVAL